MSEPTKTFLSNLALASGVGLAVGALVACAAYPLFEWWANRSTVPVERPKGSSPSRTDAPGTVVGCDADDWPTTPPLDTRAAFERLASYTEGRK